MSVRIRGLVHHFLPVPGDLTPLMLPCFKAARPCKAGRGVLPKAFVSHAQLIQPPIRPARIHTFALASRPTCASATSPSASTRIDRAHFAASTRLILPLYLGAACPIKLAWKISPYLGVCTTEQSCQYLYKHATSTLCNKMLPSTAMQQRIASPPGRGYMLFDSRSSI
jgi:hypothetical protein